jgi:DNA-binding PadR family transcriptional regulator
VTELDDLGRWADPAILILSSLAGGAKHGYAIAKDVEDFSGVALGPGTLYGALSRLETRNLIRSEPSDERRRPYSITAKGTAAATQQLRAMQRVAASGLARLAMA